MSYASSSSGGVIYPIILRYLFTKVGFPWAVRICGISSTILCAGATLLVTRRPAQHCKPTPIFDVKTFKDTRFVFLTAGSCIISLGMLFRFFVTLAKFNSPSKDYSYLFSTSSTMPNSYWKKVTHLSCLQPWTPVVSWDEWLLRISPTLSGGLTYSYPPRFYPAYRASWSGSSLMSYRQYSVLPLHMASSPAHSYPSLILALPKYRRCMRLARE